MNHRKKQGKVYLIGAGPGEPGLITVKRMALLGKGFSQGKPWSPLRNGDIISPIFRTDFEEL